MTSLTVLTWWEMTPFKREGKDGTKGRRLLREMEGKSDFVGVEEDLWKARREA